MRVIVKEDYIVWKNNIFWRLEEEFLEAYKDDEEKLTYLKELFADKGYFEIFDSNCDTTSYVCYVNKSDAENILLFIAKNGYADLRKYHYFQDSLDFFLDDVKSRWMKGYYSKYQ